MTDVGDELAIAREHTVHQGKLSERAFAFCEGNLEERRLERL